jgi:hypothetical protein
VWRFLATPENLELIRYLIALNPALHMEAEAALEV